MTPLLGTAVLWPLQQLVNHAIQADAHIASQLRGFSGKCLALQTRKPSLSLLIRFECDGLHLTALDADTVGIDPDAWIRADAGHLLSLLGQSAGSRALADPNLEIGGDTGFVQNLFQLSSRLDVEWEDYLAPLLGDSLTHQAGRVADSFTQLLSESRSRLSSSLEDYLKEEKQWVPHQVERTLFEDGLDSLKLQLDRMSARNETR